MTSSSSKPNSGVFGGGRKRGSRGQTPTSRARKKQKRLDAILDSPIPPSPLPPSDPFVHYDEEASNLRRSTRARRVPEVLDSSPIPSNRKKNPNPPPSRRVDKGKETVKTSLSFKERSTRDRRVRKGKYRSKRASERIKKSGKEAVFLTEAGGEDDGGEDEVEDASASMPEKEMEASEQKVEPCRDKDDGMAQDASGSVPEKEVEEPCQEKDDVLAEDASVGSMPEKEMEASEQKVEVFQEKDDGMAGATSGSVPEKEIEASEQKVEPCREKENLDGNAVVVELTSPSSEDKLSKSRVKEGRRCGLCGGGTDGKPPKKVVRESADSENEAYEGSSASEEPNYDVWDGFGDEPGWLGRLLGPILDRFGIARIWVHQHCAVWSPEVYFAGLGCLKNIRAALCRGRALKCSRCGRPGATIGCRVDRCLKTYHLPCSRAEGCIFDHRKFLIACNHHRHLFQPQGTQYTHQIRKRKAKKLKLELRKLSNDAWRKDVEAEEKWLENCGEDEEFLKREGKRLHRDILRIAPTYIGGSSENGNLYRGWESVAGLQDVIRCMKEVVMLPLLYPDFFSNMGLTPPRGVLLHGYPGTGKTLVVRALIGACSRGDKRITYFARKGADCLGKYVGDAERQLRLLFQVAERCQPSIIFFDEIDGLAPRRSRHQDQTHSSVVSTLLSLMDGVKSRGSVIVIGATNRPEAVDPALRRPGRFDREIYFPLPSEMDRSAILSLHTQSWPNPISGPLLSWVANQTVGYAGADLQALCTQAAMIALKRNCALQDLLSSAEKGSDCGRLPLLPSFAVEERDWLEALVLAPPPCSQREAGMAANDAVSSPLPAHLTPCLLQPLLHLLISFYNDERIWLPLTLFNASKSIKRVIISALEQKQVPNVFWQSHVHSLIQEPCIENEIVKNLARYGLVVGPSVISHSCVSDDDYNDHDKFDSFRLKHAGANVRNISMQNLPKCGNLSGFRVLISGAPKSGQRHLASCLLHGFMGQIEILKINLATISQEGHGDLLRGLTQIFSKIVNMGRCMIYMPRIDLWAISETLRQDVEESCITPMTSITAGANSRTRCVTEIWNSFVEQVASMSASASLIIMATCEVENQDLPRGIKQFFTNDVLDCGESAPSEHTIPRFFVHIGGAFNHELIINSFSENLLHDLVQHYVRLLHQRRHKGKSHGEEKVSNVMGINSQTERQSMENGHITTLLDASIDPERIISSSMASCRNDQAAQGINSDPLPLIRGHQEVGVQHSIHEASFAKVLPSKVTKGSSAVAIGTFGYQILRCPQFAELCWVTSKLREGPLSDINGPWKSWPFNSCVWHDKSSTDTVGTGVSSNNLKDSENISVVRGLIAVGLLAYKGVYTSVREVATEVRKVSEILVEQIRAKVLGGKDRYHYLRILSQVAYLEDLVNTWAYTFERSHGGNLTSESNKRVLAGRVYSDKSFSDSKLADKQSCEPSSHIKSFNETQEDVLVKSCNETQEDVLEVGSEKIISSTDHCVKSSTEISYVALCNSGASIIREFEPSREGLPSAQFPSNLHSSPSLAVSTMLTGDAICSIEVPTPCERLDGVKQLNGLEGRHICPTRETTDSSIPVIKSRSQEANVHSNGLHNVHSSRNTDSVANAPSKVADFTLGTLAASENSCLYKCCSGCLSVIYMFVRNTVSQSWESNDCLSAIDDIHDIILSCSSNLLVAFKKWCTSQCNTNLTENCSRTQSEHCACQDLCKMKYKNKSAQYKSSSKTDLLPLECRCHLRNDDDSSMIQSEISFSFQPSLTFLYRDGILIPFDYNKDLVLHCKYEKLCLCSIMEMILTIKEQLV